MTLQNIQTSFNTCNNCFLVTIIFVLKDGQYFPYMSLFLSYEYAYCGKMITCLELSLNANAYRLNITN
uniref:Uncharacterized protein n=1 Tax=Pararge aegeria TaxID=116150 RepID=S4PE90_9NEOP